MADKKIPLDEHKKQINEHVIEYLRQSELSGNTPTEEQFREFGARQVANIVIGYEDELERPDLNILKNTLDNYFETEMMPKYRRSLREHPRSVNGHEPQPISDDAYKTYSQTLKEEKSALIKDIKYLLKESERTNRTPNKDQALSWLRERMDEDLDKWNDEQGKRYVISYVDEWIGGEYDKRLSQSMRNHPRKENGHWPWKTDDQEERERKRKSQNKDGIDGTRSSGSVKGYRSRAPFASDYIKTYQSFSGYDMVCTIELPMPKGGTYTQVIGELQTITYSIHQEKTPIRCLGDMNAKGYVFGPRTIAGTLIFTVFDRHWTTKMEKEYLADAGVKAHMLADEFPPFNLTISCANEYGHDAVCSIFGITLVNEGQVMSINDVFTENTYQFYATDVQYLAPVEVTMGGTKNPVDSLPQINTDTHPSPEKPTPQPKQEPLPKEEKNDSDPDPEKPSKEEEEKPKSDDGQTDASPEESSGREGQDKPGSGEAGEPHQEKPNKKPSVPEMSEEKYKEELAKLNEKREMAKAKIKETAKEKNYPPAWERMMSQRTDALYAKEKEALDRAYEQARKVSVI